MSVCAVFKLVGKGGARARTSVVGYGGRRGRQAIKDKREQTIWVGQEGVCSPMCDDVRGRRKGWKEEVKGREGHAKEGWVKPGRNRLKERGSQPEEMVKNERMSVGAVGMEPKEMQCTSRRRRKNVKE